MTESTDRRALPEPLRADATPLDVARCVELSDVARREILTAWYADALALERADDEDKASEGRARSAEVRAAIAALDAGWSREHELR